jgi:PelA/Pel-15E family pectate lyase
LTERTREEAWELLCDWTKTEALRRHALAVEAAVAWYQTSALRGWRLSRVVDPAAPRGFDYVIEADAAAPPIWARFYDIATNRPMFVGRDGIVRQKLADIEYERRTGYAYLGPFAAELLEKEVGPWRTRIRPIR